MRVLICVEGCALYVGQRGGGHGNLLISSQRRPPLTRIVHTYAGPYRAQHD